MILIKKEKCSLFNNTRHEMILLTQPKQSPNIKNISCAVI